MRRKNHLITKEILIKPPKFDNFHLNSLLAYTAIINSLNYKWYKSSKRRILLPNFYFTRSFYNFYRLSFLKNNFRKKIQSNIFSNFLNPLGFFEKRMFLKHVFLKDFVNSTNSYLFFLKKDNLIFLKKDKFFFKKINENFNLDFGLFVSKKILLNSEVSSKINLFYKNLDFDYNEVEVDFNILIFFFIFNCSIVEIYKILIFTNFNQYLINFQFF